MDEFQKKYFDEKFDNIEKRQKETNDHLIRQNSKIEKHEVRIQSIELRNASADRLCPLRKDVEDIKEDLKLYQIIKKYPIASLIGIFIVIALAVSGAVATVVKFINT